MGKYSFKVYVTGQDDRSQMAIGALRQLCEQRLAGLYELSIIDVLERPEAAEAAKILATPTVVRELPPPPRRVVGDLSQVEQVLAHLGVL